LDDQQSVDEYLKSLDPKDWKNQDHYRLFGLVYKRFNATDEELKKACNALTFLIFI
jgi:DnaJ family protein C protein 2